MEEPGWAQVRQAARRAGLECVPITADEHGIRSKELMAHEDLRALIVAPAHQFPTGAVLDPQRRVELLRWAGEVNGLILEDDYDSEFRYDREPVGVLQGLAPERVVLHGSVSKTLSPALGLGWLAIPAAWHARVAARLASVETPGTPEQAALTGFIETGAYDRHLRRVRRLYRSRRAALIEALAQALPQARITGAEAGLHLVVRLDRQDAATPPDPGWSIRIERAGAAHGLRLSPLDFYRSPHSGVSERALVLGYGDVPEHAAVEVAGLLRSALDAAIAAAANGE